MQPHHQAIALAVTWLATLVALPLLLSATRRGAHSLGVDEGKQVQQALHTAQIKDLERAVADKRAELAYLQAHFDNSMEARRLTIVDLEERIMSYTGLAVARADFEALVSASETLNLAVRTWWQMKGAELWVRRAEQQATYLRSLALRVQSELEANAATSVTGEVA
ncbi:hypothetical protein [Pseudomonas cremoricolorata]|uniref:hypothetical protein n=1 Tax=Pseudomonas cremoricolorata TaxID=157783 RepID=UPI00048D1604|nr:hypothetical protein [Pseudomonas cremoricolorata]